MLTIIHIKRAALILLMICFVLPLSRCERGGSRVEMQGTHASASSPLTDAGKPVRVFEDKYAFQNVSADDPAASALNIATFFWPLVFLFIRLQGMSRGAATAINLAELALCAGSTYMIFGITLFGELRFGGYLAYLALAAYALMTLGQIVERFREKAFSRGRHLGKASDLL